MCGSEGYLSAVRYDHCVVKLWSYAAVIAVPGLHVLVHNQSCYEILLATSAGLYSTGRTCYVPCYMASAEPYSGYIGSLGQSPHP